MNQRRSESLNQAIKQSSNQAIARPNKEMPVDLTAAEGADELNTPLDLPGQAWKWSPLPSKVWLAAVSG